MRRGYIWLELGVLSGVLVSAMAIVGAKILF
jgi:hypothetical protein